VELHLVDAVPEAVVAAEPRAVLVGQPRPRDHLGAAGSLAERAGALGRPAAALALQRLLQWQVVVEGVVVLEHRGLVEDRVGGRRAGAGCDWTWGASWF
jgi:hypothetical protein